MVIRHTISPFQTDCLGLITPSERLIYAILSIGARHFPRKGDASINSKQEIAKTYHLVDKHPYYSSPGLAMKE